MPCDDDIVSVQISMNNAYTVQLLDSIFAGSQISNVGMSSMQFFNQKAYDPVFFFFVDEPYEFRYKAKSVVHQNTICSNLLLESFKLVLEFSDLKDAYPAAHNHTRDSVADPFAMFEFQQVKSMVGAGKDGAMV